jgi:uncharacterized FlaG/YvyC family protein
MEMQEMMERLLAEIRADRKAYQEKADADRIADQEKADADRKAYREQLQDMVKAYREDLKSDQAKMIAAFKEKTDAWIANIKDALKMTTACQEVMRANPEKIEPNSGEEETAVEEQEFPNEVVEVHPLRTINVDSPDLTRKFIGTIAEITHNRYNTQFRV